MMKKTSLFVLIVVLICLCFSCDSPSATEDLSNTQADSLTADTLDAKNTLPVPSFDELLHKFPPLELPFYTLNLTPIAETDFNQRYAIYRHFFMEDVPPLVSNFWDDFQFGYVGKIENEDWIALLCQNGLADELSVSLRIFDKKGNPIGELMDLSYLRDRKALLTWVKENGQMIQREIHLDDGNQLRLHEEKWMRISDAGKLIMEENMPETAEVESSYGLDELIKAAHYTDLASYEITPAILANLTQISQVEENFVRLHLDMLFEGCEEKTANVYAYAYLGEVPKRKMHRFVLLGEATCNGYQMMQADFTEEGLLGATFLLAAQRNEGGCTESIRARLTDQTQLTRYLRSNCGGEQQQETEIFVMDEAWHWQIDSLMMGD